MHKSIVRCAFGRGGCDHIHASFEPYYFNRFKLNAGKNASEGIDNGMFAVF